MPYCSQCGTEVESHHKFCAACGNTLGSDGNDSLSPPTPSSDASTAVLEFEYPPMIERDGGFCGTARVRGWHGSMHEPVDRITRMLLDRITTTFPEFPSRISEVSYSHNMIFVEHHIGMEAIGISHLYDDKVMIHVVGEQTVDYGAVVGGGLVFGGLLGAIASGIVIALWHYVGWDPMQWVVGGVPGWREYLWGAGAVVAACILSIGWMIRSSDMQAIKVERLARDIRRQISLLAMDLDETSL